MEEMQVLIDASLGEGNITWSATLLISSRISAGKKRVKIVRSELKIKKR
jgi:hypothetical protein